MLLRTKGTLERATHSPREQKVLQGAGKGEQHLAGRKLRASLSQGTRFALPSWHWEECGATPAAPH